MMVYIKYESSVVYSDKKIFKNCILNLLLQPIRTISTILVGDHPGQIPISGSREEVVSTFSCIIQGKIVTPGAGSILTPGA